MGKKFFAIKKRAFYCREDSTIPFLQVYFQILKIQNSGFAKFEST